ncbi:MAG: hypothetical protein CL504_03000 [Actinobacteria bacterium]|nr:hypothetical protein [Actinomycetota bacterium]
MLPTSSEKYLHNSKEVFEQSPSSKSLLFDSLAPSNSHLKAGLTENPFNDSILVIFHQFIDSSNLAAPNK